VGRVRKVLQKPEALAWPPDHVTNRPPEQTPALDPYGETVRQILSRPLPLVERELPALEDVKDIAGCQRHSPTLRRS